MKFEIDHLSFDLSPLFNHKEAPKCDPEFSIEQCLENFKQKRENGSVGFFDWPSEIGDEQLQNIQSEAERIRSVCDRALLFGIGGSYLGPAALMAALSKSDFPLQWVSNIDPREIESAQAFAKKGKTGAVVISKSGGTVETLSAFSHLYSSCSQSVTAVTDPHSGELRRLASEQNWPSFDVPPNIGGRFSVLTPVGLLPCALAGLDIKSLIEGARTAKAHFESNPQQSLPTQLAKALFLWDTKCSHSVQVLMPYWKSLKLVSDWYVQLFGESLGKLRSTDDQPVGPTPLAALGTSDQHSLLQLFRQGPKNKVVGFLSVTPGKDAAVGTPSFSLDNLSYLFKHNFSTISHEASLATEQSLQLGEVPTYRIQLGQLNEHTLVCLLFLLETCCAVSAEFYGVDGYNQPGVEESKQLLKKRLSN